MWKAKVQKRKQNNLAEEIRKIEDRKWTTNEAKSEESKIHAFDRQRFERLKDETLKDEIRNIQDILKQLSSDSTED